MRHLMPCWLHAHHMHVPTQHTQRAHPPALAKQTEAVGETWSPAKATSDAVSDFIQTLRSWAALLRFVAANPQVIGQGMKDLGMDGLVVG